MNGIFSFLETGLDLILELEFVRLYINGLITYMERRGSQGTQQNMKAFVQFSCVIGGGWLKTESELTYICIVLGSQCTVCLDVSIRACNI